MASLNKIRQREGVLGYFKGNGTNVVRIFPYSAVQFAAYEEFKKVSHLLYMKSPISKLIQ